MKCPSCGNNLYYICCENPYSICNWDDYDHPVEEPSVFLLEGQTSEEIEEYRKEYHPAVIDVCTKCGTALS